MDHPRVELGTPACKAGVLANYTNSPCAHLFTAMAETDSILLVAERAVVTFKIIKSLMDPADLFIKMPVKVSSRPESN